MTNNIYKVIDGNGRVYLPEKLRAEARISKGDIVKLTMLNGKICTQKVDIIEVGDQSPEAVESYVKSAINHMSEEKALELATHLVGKVKRFSCSACNPSI